MSRILFWIGLVALIVFAVRSKIRSAKKRHEEQFRAAQQQRQAGAPPTPPQATGEAPGGAAGFKARNAEKALADAETMLECAHCGVFFPAGEAVRFEGRQFCSKAHAALSPP